MENRTSDGKLPGLYLHPNHFAIGAAGGYGERGSNYLRTDINIPALALIFADFASSALGEERRDCAFTIWSTEEKN